MPKEFLEETVFYIYQGFNSSHHIVKNTERSDGNQSFNVEKSKFFQIKKVKTDDIKSKEII